MKRKNKVQGKKEKKKVDKKIIQNSNIAMFLIAFFLLIAFLFYFSLSNMSFTGKATLSVEEIYSFGEPIKGSVKINLKDGEFLPASTTVFINNSGDIHEYFLSDLIGEDILEGVFYVEDKNISGNGFGYGVLGERIVYPEVNFVMEILKVGGGGSEVVEKDEEVSEEVIKDNETVEDVLEVNETAPEGVHQRGARTSSRPRNISEEMSTGGKEPEEIIEEGEEIIEEEVAEPAPKGVPRDISSEISTRGKEIEVVELEEIEEIIESGETEIEEPESSLITGGVIDNEINDLSNIVEGIVSKDNPYDYGLSSLETAKIVSSEQEVELKIKNKKAVVTTGYFEVEKGFGEEFLGEDALELEIELDELDLIASDGDFVFSLVYGESEILSSMEKIVVDEGEMEEVNSTIIDEINLTVINETQEILIEVNKTLINVSNGSIKVDTTQYGAVVGMPVRWKKKVIVENLTNFVVELPFWAENISVYKIENGSFDIQNVSRKNVTKFSITGQISAEIDINKKSAIVRFFDNLFKSITGRVVDVEEKEGFVEVNITDNATEYEIKYETPGPVLFERNIGGRKIVTISSDIHYNNVLSYSELSKEVSISNIKLYHYVNDIKVLTEFQSYDSNGELIEGKKIDVVFGSEIDENKTVIYDGSNESINRGNVSVKEILNETLGLNGTIVVRETKLVSFITWIIPHLSNQTYEIIIEIEKADHLDSNRSFVEDIYESVRVKDGIWSPAIDDLEYVRVTFEENLTNVNDITVYARDINGSSNLEVYLKDGNELIAQINNITLEGFYKTYLTGIPQNKSYGTFDLRVNVGGSLEFDYIVDPISINSSLGGGNNVTTENGFSHLNLTDGSLVLYNPFDWTPGGNWTTGIFGNAQSFDGVDDYVDIPNSNSLTFTDGTNDKPFSISVWVKMNDTTRFRIVNKDSLLEGEYGLTFSGADKLFFYLDGNTYQKRLYLQSTSAYTSLEGSWHSVVATYNGNGSNTGMEIYIDGQLISFDRLSTGNYGNMSNTGNNIYIGASFQVSSSYADGSIDEVFIFNRSLNSTEIIELNNTFTIVNQTGLVSHWALNESFGVEVSDSVGSNNGNVFPQTTYDYTNLSNDGTVEGAFFNLSGGQINFGGAYEFDGVDDYVNIDSALNDLASTTTGTWSAWVKPKEGTPSDFSNIVTFGDTNANEFFIFRMENTTGLLRVFFRIASGVKFDLDTNSNPFTSGVWTHVAVVQNGTFPVLYVNGVQPTQAFSSEADKTAWFNDASGLDNGRIGALNWDSNGNGQFFNGSIDEVMIFNRSLSASEITTLYNNQTSRFIPTGSMNFTNLNFGTNNTVNVIIPQCQQYNGSLLNFSINGGTVSTLDSTCQFNEYSMSGDLTNAYLTLELFAGTNNFYSPLVAGDLTLNDYFADIIFPTITVNSLANNSIHKGIVSINATIEELNLKEVIYNWNGTNYTLFNDSVVLMMNFENRSSLGENDTYVFDVSGSGNDGTVVGGNVTTANGKYGRAMMFDGVDDYVDLGNDDSLSFTDSNAFTISIWIKPEVLDSTNREYIRKWEAGQLQYILRQDTANLFEFIWHDGTTQRIESTASPSANNWHHLVGTFESGSQTLYIDGVLNVSSSLSGTLSSSNANTYIGYTLATAKGSIDEVMILNRSLSQTEIEQLYMSNLNKYNSVKWELIVNQKQNATTSLSSGDYTFEIFALDDSDNLNTSLQYNVQVDTIFPTITFESPTPNNNSEVTLGGTITITANISDNLAGNTSSWIDWDSSLIGYWGMDSYNSTGVFDNSSFSNFGTFGGGIGTSDITTGIRGNSLEFDGVDDKISIGDVGNILTISTWVNFGDSLENYERPFSWGTNGWSLRSASNGVLRLFYGNTGFNTGFFTSASIWYNFVTTYNGTDVIVYVNGNEEFNTAVSEVTGSNSFVIGPGGSLQYLNGSIDEIMVFNRSLSQDEISALYNSKVNKFNASFSNLAKKQYDYTVYAIDAVGNLNTSFQNFTLNYTLDIDSLEWKTTGGFTDATLAFNQILDNINVSVDSFHKASTYLTVLDPDNVSVVNGQFVSNLSNTLFSWTNNVNLNKVGTWTINFTTNDSVGNTNFTTSTFSVSINTQTLRDGWYGYSENKILTNSEIIDLSTYGYDIFELEENITNTQTNFSILLDSINNSRTANIKAGLNFILDFDYNDSGLKTQYLIDVNENFSLLDTVPYTDTIEYISLELKNQEQYTTSTKDSLLNDFAENITQTYSNAFVIYSKNYNSTGLDNSYIQFTKLIYLNSQTETEFIEDQKYHFKNNASLNRIYNAIPSVVKTLAEDFHSRIIGTLRGTPVTTLDDVNASALSNNDVIIFNNGSSISDYVINVSELSVTGEDVWDSTEGLLIEINTDDLFTVKVRGYNASIIYFEDLDYIQMDNLVEGTLYKGSSTSKLETNHTDGNLDGNFGIGADYDIQIELPDPNYVQGNFITYYGWINVTSINFSSYAIVIFADQNNGEIDSFDYANTEYYGYISVADYNNTAIWNDVKNREVDDWLVLNNSLNIFVDGLDSGIIGGTNFSSRMKDLMDYVQVTKDRKGILNTYTAYESFATWGTGGVMKESCVNRWNGASASSPDSYTREDWDLELNKSVWYQNHNVNVYCQAFNNRSTDGTFTVLNYTELQNIYFASKVLGYDYFYLAQPDFQYAHEEYVYDLGTDLDRTYHLIGTDLYYRTYSNGIVYYNSTSEQGWFEDGRTINSLDICFYLYNPSATDAHWNFTVNQRDSSGSNTEYSFTQDWSVGVWKWKCADISSETPLNGIYLVEAWVGDHTVTVGQGYNLGWSSYANSGKHSWYDTSATDSFAVYPEDQNWMINISINQSLKASVDITNNITQVEVNSSISELYRNITLNSTNSFPIEIWSNPTTFSSFGNINYLNSTENWVVLNYLNSTTCDSNIPTWGLNTIESNTVKACIENAEGGTLVRVSAPSLSSQVFQIENSDVTAPTITVLSPTNTTYSTSTIWFNATASSAVDTWIINYNGTNVTVSINSTLTVEDGYHNLLLYANDSLGNDALNNTIYFSVDVTTPLISFATGTKSEGVSVSQDFIYLNISLTENSLENVSYSLYNESLNTSGLVGYWNFDRNTTTIRDLSGNTNDGTNFGSTFNSSGYLGGAYEFDGSTNYVNIDSALNDLSSTTTGSWSAWVKPVNATPSGYECFITFGDTNANELVYIAVIGAGDNNGKISGVLNVAGTTQWNIRTDNVEIADNTWTHVALVQNGTLPAIYIDGVKPAQTLAIPTAPTSWFNDASGLDNGRIGDLNFNNVGEDCFFNGSIDEVMIFDRALSQTEISELYNRSLVNYTTYSSVTEINWTGLTDNDYHYFADALDTAENYNLTDIRSITLDATTPTITWELPTPTDDSTIKNNFAYLNTTITDAGETSAWFDWDKSLVGYWGMDSYNSTGIFDNSSYSNFGSFGGGAFGVSNITSGKRGSGIEFDGVDDYVDLGNDVSLQMNQELTVSAWFKADTLGDHDGMVTKTNLAAFSDGWGITYFSGNWRFWVTHWGGAAGGGVAIKSFSDTTSWHHIVGTFDKNAGSNQVNIYIDGVLGTPGSSTINIIDAEDHDAIIGQGFIGNDAWFNGSIDELLIFNRSLSSQEILALYNNSANRLFNNFTGLTNGQTYNYSAYVIDSAGNLNISSQNFTVDTTAPEVTISLPVNGNTYTTSTVTFQVTTNENSTCNYSTDSGATNASLTANSAGTIHTLAESGFSNGDYVVNYYCDDLSGNSNNTMSASFTVSVAAAVEDDTGTGGGGGGGGIVPVFSDVEFVSVEPEVLDLNIVLGRIESGSIFVENLEDIAKIFEIEVSTISSLISFETTSLEIAPGEIAEFKFRVTAPEAPGIYTGKISIISGSVKKEMLVIIKVKTEKSLFDIIVTIPDSMKTLRLSEVLLAQIDLIQMGIKEKMDVTLNYVIKDFEGRIYLIESETIAVINQKVIEKEFRTNELLPGDYVLGAEIIYPGGVAVASSQFRIKEGLSFDKQRIFLLVVLVSLVVLFVVISFFIVKHRRMLNKGNRRILASSLRKGKK